MNEDDRAFVNLSQNLSSNFFSAWSSRYEKQVKKKDCALNLHERTQRLFTGSIIPRRDVFSAGS